MRGDKIGVVMDARRAEPTFDLDPSRSQTFLEQFHTGTRIVVWDHGVPIRTRYRPGVLHLTIKTVPPLNDRYENTY